MQDVDRLCEHRCRSHRAAGSAIRPLRQREEPVDWGCMVARALRDRTSERRSRQLESSRFRARRPVFRLGSSLARLGGQIRLEGREDDRRFHLVAIWAPWARPRDIRISHCSARPWVERGRMIGRHWVSRHSIEPSIG